VTRDEFAERLRARVEYHDQIGDGRVAGALKMVLAELESVDGLPEHAPPPDQLVELEDAARRLGVTSRWLKQRRPPYLVELSPRMLRVSERRLEQFLRTH
jgi:hypothetical protein